MKQIGAPFEFIPTMAGRVKYYTKPCHFSMKWMDKVINVGDINCKMCKYCESTSEIKTELPEVFAEAIICGFPE